MRDVVGERKRKFLQILTFFLLLKQSCPLINLKMLFEYLKVKDTP
jgi:hypothetical protein